MQPHDTTTAFDKIVHSHGCCPSVMKAELVLHLYLSPGVRRLPNGFIVSSAKGRQTSSRSSRRCDSFSWRTLHEANLGAEPAYPELTISDLRPRVSPLSIAPSPSLLTLQGPPLSFNAMQYFSEELVRLCTFAVPSIDILVSRPLYEWQERWCKMSSSSRTVPRTCFMHCYLVGILCRSRGR